MKFMHKLFLFIYIYYFFCKFSNNCLARSPTVKDNIIFKRRVKIVKNRYRRYRPSPFQLNSLVFQGYFNFFLVEFYTV